MLSNSTLNTMVKVKLNLGCGPIGIDSWINYDWGVLAVLSKFVFFRQLLIKIGVIENFYDMTWPKIHLVDIRKKFPLEDNSIDFIYCSHVLEHFERWQTIEILKECRRVLKVDGWMRIVIPDLDEMISEYIKNNKDSKASNVFFREVWGYYKDQLTGSVFDSLKKKFIRDHKWGYNKRSITVVLKEAGFQKIKEKKFRQGTVPDLKDLDIQLLQKMSLYIEAQK